ncbi:MAG: (Fe-S)-binding protein [Candidatus Helarchaeota archaeon]
MTPTQFRHLENVREMVEACFRCGDCRIAFRPAVGRYKVCPVYDAIIGKWEPFFARGKIMLANGLLKGEIKPSEDLANIIFQCMICGSCYTTCNNSYHPALNHPTHQVIDHPKIWEAFRADLTEAGYSLPRHKEIRDWCASNYNPYFEAHQKRTEWIPPETKFAEDAEYVLFVGCTESYRLPSISKNILKILDACDLKYTLLGSEEWCCGSVALRTGDIALAKKLAQHNLEALKKTKASKIITHCAGCYRTLKIDYPTLLPEFQYEVLHITELIHNLLTNEQLQFSQEIPETVTYHDPCHLGRHSQIYDAPRTILKRIPGLTFVEMQRTRENSWCCGAGGGVKSGFPELALEIAKSRITEALNINVDAIVTACPFCLRNLENAIQNMDNTPSIKVYDLLDLILTTIAPPSD